MRSKLRPARLILGASLLMLAAALTASAQDSQDPLQAIKDSLGGGNGQDNGGLLQDVLGNGNQNGTKKTDKKLENPETVAPPCGCREHVRVRLPPTGARRAGQLA